jgi:hypothetical protein
MMDEVTRVSGHPAGPSWLACACRRDVVRRGLRYAIVVGAVLITINHGAEIVRGDVTVGRALRIGLTLLVPYLVATFASVEAIRARHKAAP